MGSEYILGNGGYDRGGEVKRQIQDEVVVNSSKSRLLVEGSNNGDM